MTLRPTNNGTAIEQVLDRWRPRTPRMRFNPQELIEEDLPDPKGLIPDYLVPVGDTGFYVTPMEPADPTDCERYPASPWCGGPGIRADDVVEKLPFAYNPEFQRNSCEACIILNPSLFWIILQYCSGCKSGRSQVNQPNFQAHI
ncbi:hypothetical protein [Leptolyngbya sp. 7M]|uniref:hypothetical protein n=1 Tax=Leptolyngbya sp. 7M TaxID=2812896 RepID=UPI001B8B1730|nr:hypothetical protein [Leptolyngbya sp. 7M]QYO64283.1 hypothetical protein JVX88_31950 [Leptolyngbya sp. 7M]